MTPQEIYDKVVTFLLNQGKQSLDERGCLYRSPDGSMCAAGCLILDMHYHPDLEEFLAEAATVTNALIFSGVPMNIPRISELVSNLQAAHDNIVPYTCELPGLQGSTDFMSFFPANARAVAEFHHLSTSVLDNHPALNK